MKLNIIKQYAYQTLKADTSGHDFYHVQRVAHLAQNLWNKDHQPTTNDTLIAASYLHDTIDEKIVTSSPQALKRVTKLLQTAECAPSEQEQILTTITHMSFADNLAHHYQLPLIGQYVQDADRLDALGAVGIARAFAYGGKQNQPLYDPKIKPRQLTSHSQYRQHPTTTINHFYEKLFQLQDTMNTPAGYHLAQQRTIFMQEFLAKFMQEWQGQI
ncbi:MAG: HD domain-containing protein [Lactobacillus sp.]|uniref:HD domain-containing protein n=1 Tax=Bombilactobacillus bombi TaxID=1303590 RepID=UPI0035EB487E|nr:HD domain-containing protein [Lactobacillus sp.]